MIDPKDVSALLFDLGGVVIGINFDHVFTAWASYAHEPAEVIKERFTFDEFYKRHERGEIDGQQYFSSLRRSLGINRRVS